MPDTLILTLELDPESFERLDTMRGRWFPTPRWRLPAHLTLFHRLPGEELNAAVAYLDDLAARMDDVPMRFGAVRPFATGTAIDVRSASLRILRAALAAHWRAVLTRQDQRFDPHVTVQNKVPRETAERDRQDIRARFAPWQGRGTGFLLWHYRGGPWEPAWSGRFGGPPAGGIE